MSGVIGQDELVVPTYCHHTVLAAVSLNPDFSFISRVKQSLFASCKDLLPIVRQILKVSLRGQCSIAPHPSSATISGILKGSWILWANSD